MTQSQDEGVAPSKSWAWLRRLLPGRLQPAARGLRKRIQRLSLNLDEPFRTVFPFTQAHPVRQQNIVRLSRLIEQNNVPGAVVECGVLDGGMAALMAWGTRASSQDRPIHLFDAWRGLPPPTSEDGSSGQKWEGEVVGSPKRVRSIMSKMGIEPARLHFHVGWFHETFPSARIDKIALLHIDPDFYEPVKLCLERWYPVLSPGGYIQIDDYEAFSGCRKAVDEFLAAHPDIRLETSGDTAHAFYFVKPVSTA